MGTWIQWISPVVEQSLCEGGLDGVQPVLRPAGGGGESQPGEQLHREAAAHQVPAPHEDQIPDEDTTIWYFILFLKAAAFVKNVQY